MQGNFSAVILSGGLNTRMQGLNKSFLKLQGQYFLHRVLGVLKPLFQEIILVTRQPDLYPEPGLRVVEDIFQIRSSLTGIHAGLLQATHNQAFVTACDMPLLQTGLIKLLLASWHQEYQVLVPKKDGFFEPLCAIYSKGCLPWIEDLLHQQQVKISNLYRRVLVQELPETILRQADPELLSFLNINCQEDLLRVQSLLNTKALSA
ncbi:MAG: molybdenum cofactor guanylyltransferase [Desulfohalobiaceae bacterium]